MFNAIDCKNGNFYEIRALFKKKIIKVTKQ